LILDEPTAALDTESEELLMEGLDRLMRGRTVITITHRLNTIREANTILVIHEGIVAEQGTHDELLGVNGLYADLYWSRVAPVGSSVSQPAPGTGAQPA
jgi:ABC-type multidrug transport system fused ATPase/permease subunit